MVVIHGVGSRGKIVVSLVGLSVGSSSQKAQFKFFMVVVSLGNIARISRGLCWSWKMQSPRYIK